jgi:hypothetical protein
MAIPSTSLLHAALLLPLLAVSACGPTGGTVANSQVNGDPSTIQGDRAATMDRRQQ